MSIALGFLLSFLFLLALLTLWKVPQYQVSSHAGLSGAERAALINEYRHTLAQLLGGTLLLCGLYFTWREFQDSRDARIPERFARAVEQMTDSSMTSRLGGIHALARIAADSERKEDDAAVLSMLLSYVRERTDTDRTAFSPPADEQLAFIVLGNPSLRFSRTVRNLSDVNFRGAMLLRADLSNTVLYRSDFRNATLFQANLRHAKLVEAMLGSVELEEADLTSACLEGADLRAVRNLDKARGLTRDQLELAVLDDAGKRIAERLRRGGTGCER